MKILPLALILAALSPVPALADDPPGPVCGRPAVLEELAFTLRRAGRPLLLEPAPVGEVSTGSVVRCAVRGHVVVYDTDRISRLPLDRPVVVAYALELRRNGILLRLE